jgi:eukaryotic-like serine/threonine-protein kinase
MKVCPTCMAEFGGGEVFCPVDGARLTTASRIPPPVDDPLVGDMLSERYRVLRPIGEGGMGIVYEAEHVVIEKRVAIKVLREDFSSKEDVVERFRQEARSASRIGHENIVDIMDFGETPDGRSYFVMEYLVGEDLASLLEREGTVAPDRAVRLALQCCRALGAAHRKGIVHRDMKPENVFLVRREDGTDFVKVVDFGIAKMSQVETGGAPGRKLTKTGMIFGTPEYMSSELAAGKPQDHRVDIYALGIILYEMITGRVPFMGDSFMAVLSQHMFEEPPRLWHVNPGVRVHADLEAVILRALAKDPDDRYATMEELAQGLSSVLDWSESPGTDPGVADPMAPRMEQTSRAAPTLPRMTASEPPPVDLPGARSSRVTVVAAGGAVLVAALGVGLWLLSRDAPADATPGPAEASAAESPSPEEGGASEVAAAAGAEGADEAPADEAPQAEDGVEPAEEPGVVTMNVRTEPAGARLTVEGHGQVCASTPCSFEVARGEPLVLEARRGRQSARERVEPSDHTDVSLRLSAPARASAGPPQGDAPAPSTPTDTATPPTPAEADEPPKKPEPPPEPPADLKVPDIFR